MVLTFRTVMSMSDKLSFASLFETLKSCNHIYLTLSVFSMCAYIGFKGAAINLLLRTFSYPRRYGETLLYSAADTYFSAVTPSASGGQPAAMYFMHKNGIPTATATVTLLVNLILVTMSTLLTGVAAFAMHTDLYMRLDLLPRIFIIGGMVLLVLLISGILLLLKEGEIIYRFGKTVIRLLVRIHILRNQDRWASRLRRIIDQYKECVQMTHGRGKMLVLVYLMGLGHKFTQITTTMLVHLALGGDPALCTHVWASTSFAQLGSGCFPMPGGMGIVDYLLLQFFTMLMPYEKAIELELISRSVACYLCMILSGLGTLTGYLVYRFSKKDREKTGVA